MLLTRATFLRALRPKACVAIEVCHAMLGLFDIAMEVLRDNSHSRRRLIRAYCRVISPPELLYTMDATGFKALGQPKGLTIAGFRETVLEVLRRATDWLPTRALLALLPDPKPSESICRRALQSLAEDGDVQRIPPLSVGAIPGQTPYWRISEAGDGPSAH